MIIASPKLIPHPVVSVFIITYNQEETIAQTIESILVQKGELGLELIIAEDAGSDGTASICKEYQQRYPEKIKLLLQDTNQGLVKNYIDAIRLCRGNYIAVCAGDDYWIDDRKIEKQLQFFDKHPDYGVVSTSGYRLLVKKNKFIEGFAPLHPVANGYVFDKTWRGGVYAMPLSLLIRADLLAYIDFDEFLERNFSVEDVPMQAILAKHTRFGHIPDLCCVYRVYNESLTFTNYNSPRYLYYHQGLVNIKRYLDELFPGEVEFTEQWAHDYMKYRRFLVAVYNFDYGMALDALNDFIQLGTKEKRAILFSKTKIGFYIFCLLKRIKNYEK